MFGTINFKGGFEDIDSCGDACGWVGKLRSLMQFSTLSE